MSFFKRMASAEQGAMASPTSLSRYQGIVLRCIDPVIGIPVQQLNTLVQFWVNGLEILPSSAKDAADKIGQLVYAV